MKEEENKGKEYREREGERGDKKRKGNAFIVHLITGHEGPEGEQRYSTTLYLTSALDAVDGQRHAPAVLPPGKTRYLLYRRLGGAQGRSGRVRKISPAPRFDPLTVRLCVQFWSCCSLVAGRSVEPYRSRTGTP